MSKSAKSNPIGLPTQPGWRLVRVGDEGERVHIYNPTRKAHYCRSGIKHGKVPKIYDSDAKMVSCGRCQKLASVGLNPNAGVK